MEFARLPDAAGDITVTLAANGVRFAGADAGMPGGVSVSYAAGTIVVVIDRAYAASRAHRIRLPLKANQRLQLMGTAMAVARFHHATRRWPRPPSIRGAARR